MMPNITPTIIDDVTAMIVSVTGNPVVISSRIVTILPSAAPATTPMKPPIPVSVAASTRNCNRMSPVVAPSALRRPISFVRSVTDTIMIAMTPIPPTSNATLDNTMSTRKNTPVMALNVSST